LTPKTERRIKLLLSEQERAQELRAAGLRPRYRCLFHGAAGTGKTLISEAIAKELGRKLHIFNLEGISGTNPDDATKSVMDALRIMNQSEDVFLFDEFDAISSSRTSGTSTERRTSNALLIAFENITSNAILVCATNFIRTVDPAFRRRFDTICEFELPSTDERADIIKATLAKHKVSIPEDDLKEAAKGTEGLSFHEAEELALCAIKASIVNQTPTINVIAEIPAALERRNTFKQLERAD
jgi:SpoVK/Ycf46/Vps4 family AAA+-type ATPase